MKKIIALCLLAAGSILYAGEQVDNLKNAIDSSDLKKAQLEAKRINWAQVSFQAKKDLIGYATDQIESLSDKKRSNFDKAKIVVGPAVLVSGAVLFGALLKNSLYDNVKEWIEKPYSYGGSYEDVRQNIFKQKFGKKQLVFLGKAGVFSCMGALGAYLAYAGIKGTSQKHIVKKAEEIAKLVQEKSGLTVASSK